MPLFPAKLPHVKRKKVVFFGVDAFGCGTKELTRHSPCTYLINRAAFKSAKIATAKSGAREGQHRCPQKIICEHQFGSSAVTEGRRNTSTNQISTSVTGEMCTPLPAARRNICPISLNTSRLCVPHIRTSLSGAAVPTRS